MVIDKSIITIDQSRIHRGFLHVHLVLLMNGPLPYIGSRNISSPGTVLKAT